MSMKTDKLILGFFCNNNYIYVIELLSLKKDPKP